MSTTNYYFMSCAEQRSAACAIPPEGKAFPHVFAEEIQRTGRLPHKLMLKRVVYRDGKRYLYDDFDKLKTIWNDCLLNSTGLFLCSMELRNVINDNLTGAEGVKWMACTITSKTEERDYYFPFFTKPLDVLDSDGLFLDEAKAAQYAMFTISRRFNWQVPFSMYVSKELKRAIFKAGLQKGIYFNGAGVFF